MRSATAAILGVVAERTEKYVIGLLEELLGPAVKGKRWPWALGDVSERTGRAVELPFDAYWPDRRLIVEVDEDQHRESDAFFDKPERLTVSGVHRGEQRRIYDQRKRSLARKRGYTVVVIEWSRRRRPDRERDLAELRRILDDAGVAHRWP